LRAAFDITYRFARRIVIGLVGATVLLAGVIMIVTPGPAFVVIPVGLAILGLEFAWARRWLAKVRERISEEARKRRSRKASMRRGEPLDP
jgi:tellurite resistance protein TerC